MPTLPWQERQGEVLIGFARLDFAPARVIEVPKVVLLHRLECMIRSRGCLYNYIRQAPILEIIWYSQSSHGKRNISQLSWTGCISLSQWEKEQSQWLCLKRCLWFSELRDPTHPVVAQTWTATWNGSTHTMTFLSQCFSRKMHTYHTFLTTCMTYNVVARNFRRGFPQRLFQDIVGVGGGEGWQDYI